jgi:hypothetical protein
MKAQGNSKERGDRDAGIGGITRYLAAARSIENGMRAHGSPSSGVRAEARPSRDEKSNR